MGFPENLFYTEFQDIFFFAIINNEFEIEKQQGINHVSFYIPINSTGCKPIRIHLYFNKI